MGLKKASEGGGIVWCHDSGNECVTYYEEESAESRSLFAAVEQNSPFYDSSLDELSGKLNGLVGEVRGRGDGGRGSELRIGLLKTGVGFLLVWKRQVKPSERLEDLVDVGSLTDLSSMTSDQLNEYLRIDRDDESSGGVWRKHYTTATGDDGLIHCVGAGKSCFVTALRQSVDSSLVGNYFPTVTQDSPVYDPGLHDGLTAKLNDLVHEVQARGRQNSKSDPRVQIGFVITGRGLLPAWKLVLSEEDQQDDAASVDLDSMTDAQRDKFLRVKS
ncbi:hypothetical protein ACFVJK_33185 [Streptomyces sp. NPDC127172]|uniref:hypothetical protein n=1 Tax=Streptomyces sp. NPDC127172 TaxID=3345382 RepID=UPI0036350EF2